MADTRQSHMTPSELLMSAITIGVVVDANDPQQMGRLRVLCPAFNDRKDSETKDIPWAEYVSPFAGEVQVGTRGSDDDQLAGPTAYGMWAIPKVGAQALVMCVDGNPQHRVWMGCLYGQFSPHTMPHGRFSYKDEAEQANEQRPFGPMDSYEGAIDPLHTNTQTAFPNPSTGDVNHEYETRGADFQVAAVSQRQISETLTQVSDDQDQPIPSGGNLPEMRQGYQLSRLDPDQLVENNITDANFDNMVTAIVSPGFHAISMDDRMENTRMRVRTTSGHQIIMDDTNQRVYISTAKGNNWIEMDQEGNIDIYTSGKISAHAAKDINFTADGSFRVSAKRGIHLQSDKEIRLTAGEDISVKGSKNIRLEAGTGLLAETISENINIKSASKINVQANSAINVTAGEDLKMSSSGATSFDAGGDFTIGAGGGGNWLATGPILLKGSLIDLNGANPSNPLDVTASSPAGAFEAFLTNRVPEHEPWGRTGTISDDSHDPLVPYNSDQNGIKDFTTGPNGIEREADDKIRGPLWRR